MEVPFLVEANRFQSTYISPRPPQLAAVNRTSIHLQALTMEAALSGKVVAVYHDVMLDPLTTAVGTLP